MNKPFIRCVYGKFCMADSEVITKDNPGRLGYCVQLDFEVDDDKHLYCNILPIFDNEKDAEKLAKRIRNYIG